MHANLKGGGENPLSIPSFSNHLTIAKDERVHFLSFLTNDIKVWARIAIVSKSQTWSNCTLRTHPADISKMLKVRL